MKLYCLSSDAAKPCFVLSFKELLIMLDCGLSAHSVLNFLPLPPVPSTRLASLPNYTPPHLNDPLLEGELKECCGRVFVDSIPEFCPPLDKVVDFSQLDVILISNYTCMMALPFITEDTGFKGQVYATEPTLQIGRFYLEELAEWVSGAGGGGRRGGGPALEGAAARAARPPGARRPAARLAPPVRARVHRARAGPRARGGLRRARGHLRRAGRHGRQLGLLPRLRQLGAALGAREGGVRQRLVHPHHAPAAHQPGGPARRRPAGAGGADADAGAQPGPHAGRPVRARHGDAARRRLRAVPRVPVGGAVRPAGVPVGAPGHGGPGVRAAVRGVDGGGLVAGLQQHPGGVGVGGQAGARVPPRGALPARGAGARRPPQACAVPARRRLQRGLPPALRRVLRTPEPALRRRRAPGGAVGQQPGARHYIHGAGFPVSGRAGAVPAARHEGVPLPHRHFAQLLAGQQAGARAAAARAGAARAVRRSARRRRAAPAHRGRHAHRAAAARRRAHLRRAARPGAGHPQRGAGGARGPARCVRRPARRAAGRQPARARLARVAGRGPPGRAGRRPGGGPAPGLGGAGRGRAGAGAGARGRGGRARGARRGRLHRAPAAPRHAGARGAPRHARVL